MKRLLTAAAALLMVGALAACDPETTGTPGTSPGGQPAQVSTTAAPGNPTQDNPAPGTAPAKATTLPNRDDVNVDARDFESQGHYYFQSPSKNIKCGIYVDDIHTVGCQLKNATVIPAGLSCANNPAHEVAAQVSGGAAQFICLNQGVYVGPPTDGSTAPGFHEGGGKVLEYGQTIGVRGVICESMTSGIRCSVGGHGFFIAADNQSLF
ncbi:hypothetical protein [Nocardia concava]|uniref:hypothetical protein n=1 Tax=Nocardia concava TaxID=257281 RepID=UPI001FE0CD43|nr:hypothetical protein [Nocardia concava]